MERIYRGYPQALRPVDEPESDAPVTVQNAVPQPYMIYNREERDPQTLLWDEKRRMQVELDYFRGLYPMEAKRLQRIVEAEFDRIDQDRGPMYDEYPDREFIYQVRDGMLARALTEGIVADRDLLHVLLLYELLRRRALRY